MSPLNSRKLVCLSSFLLASLIICCHSALLCLWPISGSSTCARSYAVIKPVSFSSNMLKASRSLASVSRDDLFMVARAHSV